MIWNSTPLHVAKTSLIGYCPSGNVHQWRVLQLIIYKNQTTSTMTFISSSLRRCQINSHHIIYSIVTKSINVRVFKWTERPTCCKTVSQSNQWDVSYTSWYSLWSPDVIMNSKPHVMWIHWSKMFRLVVKLILFCVYLLNKIHFCIPCSDVGCFVAEVRDKEL